MGRTQNKPRDDETSGRSDGSGGRHTLHEARQQLPFEVLTRRAVAE